MATISFSLDSRSEKNGMSAIRMRIYHAGTNCFVNTGVRVEPQCFTGDLYRPIKAKANMASEKSAQLRLLVTKFEQLMIDIDRDESLSLDTMTANDIRTYLIGERVRPQKRVRACKTNNQDFMDWFDKYGKEKETKENRNSKTKYGVSDRSVNNVIKGMRLVMGFAVEMKYMDENPFEKIKTRVVTSKRRELVDEDTLNKIDTHLRTTNQRGFLLVCMLLYNTFLRPNEIRQLQIKDIHLFEHKIILPGEAAKNKYERTVGITEDIERLMLSLGIQNADQFDYLVGKDFKICDTMAPEHDYRVAWGKMRDELGLPEEMQLYSLKDTGITDSLESGVPSIDVMKQAGHHDLRITTKYANHEDKKLASKMYEKGLRFAK